jgi:putative hydrolase of the HAD superfamily
MISAILFDFGGTLDSDGQHWLDRFYRIYEQIGLSNLPRETIKEAFYWADAKLEEDPAIRKAGFRLMMERHVRYQFEKLGLNDPAREGEAAAAFYRPCEKVLHRNRGILEKLHHQGLHMGVISNFYGNVETLCREAGLAPFLDVILDSIIVGLKKPDPEIFQLALDKLKRQAPDVAFVGDSFERDIVPAKAMGMTTFWLASEKNKIPPDPSKVDHILHSLEDLPRHLHHKHSGVPA